MSPLRTCALVGSALASAICLARISAGVPGSNDTFAWLAGVAAAISCGFFGALTVRDHVDERLRQISEQITEYGDRRESDGYLAGVREAGAGHLSRVK